MKRSVYIITAICVFSLSFFLFTGCPSDVESLPAYYIMFKLDGESKIFDKGFTDVKKNAFANKYGVAETDFFATSDELINSGVWTNYLEIFLNGISEGTYSNVGIYYKELEEDPWYEALDGSLTITKYEEVGGVIEGTFSATVTNIDTKNITEGKFKVKRIPNDTWRD